MKILLFIPCYNCEKQITAVLNTLDCEISKYFTEILVIDNISRDNTLAEAQKWAQAHIELPLKIMKNESNYNLGGSHKTAFNYAVENNFDYVVVLHGDNQGDITDIKEILEKETYKNYDCTLGARFKKGSKLINYSKIRTVGNIAFNILFSICLFKKIYDLGAGLNIYSVNMLKSRFYEKFPDALTFNYLMILALDYYKHSYMFFPLTWKEDGQISNVKVLNQAFDLLNKLFSYLLNREKFIKSELRAQIVEEYKMNCIYSNLGK